MNKIFIYFFSLSYFISYTSLQKIQYKNDIDKFLSKWNTSFENTYNIRNDNRSEDIEAIFGPYNEAKIKIPEESDNIEVITLEDVDNSYSSNNISEKSPVYQIYSQKDCDNDIVIQQKTYLLNEVDTLLPYRSTVFISCKTNRLPDISIRHGIYYPKLDSKEYKAYIINSVDMLPGTVFVVNNRTVLIDSLESTQQIISSSNIYLNIINKNNNFKPLQFSYNSSVMRNASHLYSNSLPFSQTFFVQIYSMGSFLNTSKIPNEEDRNLLASFNDLTYCSENRICNGSYFIGKNDTPFSFLREDSIENVYTSIFDFVTYSIDKFRYRQIVSQQSQYEYNIIKTGITFNNNTVFISETEEDFINGNVQKELSHALGHTYNLSDNSGPSNISFKSMYYYLDTNLDIISPFDSETNYQSSGVMNGAILTKDIYPRFNTFSNTKIYELMRNSPIIPNEVQKSLVNGGSTLFIVTRYKDFFLFKLNIDITRDVNVSLTQCQGCETKIDVYETIEKKNPVTFYLNTTLPQKIPDTWLNSSNFIVVSNQYLEKLFFLPNEAKEMALPLPGIVPDSFTLIPAYRKGVKQVEPIIDNFWLLNNVPVGRLLTTKNETNIKETPKYYQDLFLNTSYITFLPEDGYWKENIYFPDISNNETKIVYIYSKATYNIVISYQSSTNSITNFTLDTDYLNDFILRYKNGTWSNDSISLNYQNVKTPDLFISKISPYNIVYLNIPQDFENIEIPSSKDFDNIIIIIKSTKDVYANLILNYNKKNILLKAGKNVLTYIKNGWATINPNTDIHC